MRSAYTFVFALVSILLTACGTVSLEEYASEQPALVPETFFNGSLVATGVLKDRRGQVTRRFRAAIEASWENGVGTLDEDFVFSDGEESRRVWTLRSLGDGRYRANAGDVVGDGEARVAGNAMFLDYVLRVPYGDASIDLAIDDRMYLVTPDVLINESVMRKFGFRVGEIVLSIHRQDPRP